MSEDPKDASATTGRLDAGWRTVWYTVKGAYCHLSTATRCILGVAAKLLVLGYFIFCALFLTLRYVILPEIDSYKVDIEKIASRAIGRPVSIADIDASWSGLRPQLELTEVVIHDQAGKPALALPKVSATLSWSTVLVGELRFENLTIVKPDLSILRDADGKFFVAGLPTSGGQDNSAGADWVLSQREIVIRDGKIRWRDDKRGAPELALNDVNLVLHNRWRLHQMALKATPPADYAAPLDVRASFYHPSFAGRISDVTRWKGTLYADLRNTDLAVWKPYFDYPLELSQGKGSVRAWLDLDHTKVANFTADLSLSNLSARLDKRLEPLQLARVDGRVSGSEIYAPDLQDGIPTFGANGHKLALTNFSLQTEDGFVLPSTTISEVFEPATRFHPEKMKVEAGLLDLALLSNLAERLPLTPSQHKLLSDLAPRGQLKDFTVQWEGSYPEIQAYRIRGGFSGLSMQAQAARPAQPKTATQPAHTGTPAIPGYANLSGQIDATERAGKLSLASQNMVFQLPAYFADGSLPVDKLDLQSHWEIQKNDTLLLHVDSMDFALQDMAGTLSGTHLLPLTGKTSGAIDMKARLSRFDLSKLARYLPSNTAKPASDWISGALLDGQASDVDIVAKGELADFPFRNPKPGSKSEFRLSGKFDRLKINYSPTHFAADGRSPEWPLLEDVRGTVSVDRSRLEILAESGKTHGVAVSDVKASIPDVLKADSALEIDGVAAGAMQDFLHYVKDSPVAHWIGNFTDDSKAAGNAKLQLKLELPLHHIVEAKVDGNLQFMNNDIALLAGLPTVYRTSGKLEFNEKGFNLNGIKGTFLNEPVTVAGGTQRDGNTLVRVDGSVTADGLRKAYSQPVLQRLLGRLGGASRYTATIAVRQHLPEITIESSLQGMALDLPVPLQKAANESWPLKFEIVGLPSDDPLVQRDEIRLSLGSAMAARYRRQKVLGKQDDWQVLSGGIGFGQPAPQPDSGLSVYASARSMNIDQWVSFRSAISKEPDGRETPPDPGMSAYLEPDVIAGRATELLVMGKKLDNVLLGASHQNKTWQVNIASDQATGYATWSESDSGRGLGLVTARLATLNIPKGAAGDVSDVLESNGDSATRIPALDIVADDFQLFGKKLGRLELKANNVRVSIGSEWRINKLTLINPDAELRAAGNWMAFGRDNTSNLTYALDISDAGKLLERFGFVGVVRGGKGQLDGDVSWKGLPFSLDIPSLTGQVHMDMHSGQFLKVDPGAAKLLGVLNLQALPRRLALDFRDVFSQGFAFDNIVGTASIAQGIATTDNLKMTGVAASVLMNGSADIAKETQNLHLVVIPEVNLGTASLVALAINPLVGVGTFLAQLFLRNPLMKTLTFEYNVTGSWSDPLVVKQEHATADANGKPAAK
ncbi:YhdP family protein [Herbaspirillum sp. RV1423]|uniref:YhdP family protein n=1 Tax=Herbaspirillum sp. RV1423 TaxID=1443993 RepID=UPI0004B783CA|nr:YhdP family protein [Herbaspirillum sp. RV1423]